MISGWCPPPGSGAQKLASAPSSRISRSKPQLWIVWLELYQVARHLHPETKLAWPIGPIGHVKILWDGNPWVSARKWPGQGLWALKISGEFHWQVTFMEVHAEVVLASLQSEYSSVHFCRSGLTPGRLGSKAWNLLFTLMHETLKWRSRRCKIRWDKIISTKR